MIFLNHAVKDRDHMTMRPRLTRWINTCDETTQTRIFPSPVHNKLPQIPRKSYLLNKTKANEFKWKLGRDDNLQRN